MVEADVILSKICNIVVGEEKNVFIYFIYSKRRISNHI